jgi:hypothetical protein
MSKAPL